MAKTKTRLPGGTSQVSEAVARWRADCPFRLWLDKEGPDKMRVRLRTLVVQLDVVRQSVYAWIHGIADPKEDRWPKIEKLTGITQSQWTRWMGKKPAK